MYLDSPIKTPFPDYEAELVPLKTSKRCRVFLNKERHIVFKYFSSETPHEHPNLDLLNSVGGYSDVLVEEVTSTLSVLKYRYISGDHKPTKLTKFRGVVQMLVKLHDQGYVHGDVRLQNIVFTENNSVLIDFDLAIR